MELKPCDLDRFDKWAVQRGWDAVQYSAACEAFESQQKLIDQLQKRITDTMPRKVRAIFS